MSLFVAVGVRCCCWGCYGALLLIGVAVMFDQCVLLFAVMVVIVVLVCHCSLCG